MYKSINIPEILKNYSYWGYWRHIYKEGNAKPAKVPYRTDGKPASPSNSDDWTTFDKAILSYNNSVANGLGFLIDMKHPVCFVDIDNCIDDNGNLSKIAQEIVAFFKSYTEVSQSGKGIHILFEGNKDYIDILLKWNKNIKLGLEFYIDKRYCAITGDVYNELGAIRQVPNLDVAEFIEKYKPRAKEISTGAPNLSTQASVNKYLKSKNFKKSPKMQDFEILNIIKNSKQAEKFNQLYINSGKYVDSDESSNDLAICNILAFYTQNIEQIARIWRSSKLDRDKLSRKDYVYKFTIHNAISGLSATYQSISKERSNNSDIWDKEFVAYDKGEIIPKMSISNMTRLMELEGIELKYNEMSRELEFNGNTFRNGDDVTVLDFAVKHGFKNANISTINNYMDKLAQNNSYHPVREYLDNLNLIDSNEEIDKLSNTLELVNEDDRPYVDMLLRKWLISCVAAIYEPNYRSQGVLTLQGKQSIGKSTWFRKLFPENSFCGEFVGLDVNNRDSIQKATKYWTVELAELESTFKKDFIALKGFITSEYDEYRAAYERKSEKHKRKTVFCGTVNSNEFLKDDTGDRRFWIIEIDKIDMKADIDISRLWGEVLYLYKVKAETYYLDYSQVGKTIEKNREYTIKTEIDDVLDILIDDTLPKRPYTNAEIMDKIRNYRPVHGLTSTILGKALHKRGYHNIHKKINGKNKRIYDISLKDINVYENYSS
jgi:hypothetical protein